VEGHGDVSGATPALARVVVVGSANVDVVTQVERFPLPGETVHGSSVTYGLGGKGLNQTMAAALAGVHAALVAAVGDDVHGRMLLDGLRAAGVDVLGVDVLDVPTGSAHIVVDAAGANQIVVVAGANGALTSDLVLSHQALLTGSDVLVVQGEAALAGTLAAVRAARAAGVRVVVNLAPVVPVGPEVMLAADPLVVNEVEAAALLDTTAPRSVPEAFDVAARLAALGPATVIVTLGAQGAVVLDGVSPPVHVPAPAADRVVDTTGAGDALVGVLAARLAAGAALVEAVRDAVRAATATVGVAGAAASYPPFAQLLDLGPR